MESPSGLGEVGVRMELLWEGLIEGMQPQNSSEGQDGTADPADTGVSRAQTQNSCSVCAGRLSPPAGSSPDTVGLQCKGRKIPYIAINNTPLYDCQQPKGTR